MIVPNSEFASGQAQSAGPLSPEWEAGGLAGKGVLGAFRLATKATAAVSRPLRMALSGGEGLTEDEIHYANLMPKVVNGRFNYVVHANEERLGETAESIALKIKADPEYVPGMDVRILGCKAWFAEGTQKNSRNTRRGRLGIEDGRRYVSRVPLVSRRLSSGGSLVMYFEDLSECSYFWDNKGLLSIGWLEKGKDYTQGRVPENLYEKLLSLLDTMGGPA